MNRKAPLRALAAWLAGVTLLLLAAAPAGAVSLPPQFDDALVTQVDAPTAFAFTPDGRMLVTSKTGAVRIYAGGQLLPSPALDLSGVACTNEERGVLGVAVDPSFASNHYVYVFYTRKEGTDCPVTGAGTPVGTGDPVNRVSRFVLDDDDTIDPASETVLIHDIPSPSGGHNGGDLQFGPDGYLYVTTGDGGCDWLGDSGCQELNDAARDQHVLLGKVLRVTASGDIPPGNPFQGADSDRCDMTGQTTAGRKCQETFAWGLRNPFRISFDSNASGSRFFVNDVGQSTWEEIDEGAAGADYGWNTREGFCATGSTTDCGAPPAGMTNPIFAYGHSDGCKSITGGAFVPNGVWPSQYDGAYLYADYVCGKVFALTPDGAGGYTTSVFASDAGAVVSMRFAPYGASQALFYLDYGAGEVRRLTFDHPPLAALDADVTSGELPLTVNFDGGRSSDPDGDALTYEWDFGDGSSATGKTASHDYTQAGPFTAKLTVRDPSGASDSATVVIHAGNSAPVAGIDAPLPGKRFHVGEQLVLTASGVDAEDGALPAGAFSWRAWRVHDDHTHPYMASTAGNDVTFVAPGPESLAAAADSRLEIELTARDSGGKATIVTQALEPQLTQLTFDTAPASLYVDVAGKSITGPYTITSWQGLQLDVEAYDQAASNDEVWAFAGWSDGGDPTHTITTPGVDATYTAAFQLVSAPPRPPPLEATEPTTAAPWTPSPGTGSGSNLRLQIGGDGRDHLVGTNGRDRACGRGGADVISLAGGNDVGYGGECGTTGSAAKVVEAIGARVRDGNDVLRGGAGRDRLYGNGANDKLDGGQGADSLTGDGGNDRLIGGAGTDRFFGGPGNDVIDARDGRREIVDCGAGRDRAFADRVDVLLDCELPKPSKKQHRKGQSEAAPQVG